MKARHLETIELPMRLGVGELNVLGLGGRYVPNSVEVVLSALTKLPALKPLTLYLSPYTVRCVVLK